MNRRIAFLMPGRSPRHPIGGYKVVYTYSNYLVSKGYEVSIIYPITINLKHANLLTKLKNIVRYAKWKIERMSGRYWFELDNRVKEKIVCSLDYKYVGEYDYYFATQVETSFPLSCYPSDPRHKYYLIQDYESWQSSDVRVKESYKLGLRNIVISNWLAGVVAEAGAKSTIIKNGFDFNYFRLTNPIERRNPKSILMLYHLDERKGVTYGLEAINKLYQKHSKLTVTLFGTPSRPDDLPEWIDYVQSPSKEMHNKLYNNAAIYIAPSIQEGWGLTVGEAMICGAAIVCSEAKGFKEMVVDMENGVIFRTADVDDIVEKVNGLIKDKRKRIEIAKKGNQSIQNFTWQKSFEALESILNA